VERNRRIPRVRIAPLALAALAWLGASAASGADSHTTKPFSGAKVNGGTVTHTKTMGKNVLTLSDDFVDPKTPDVHWQVVDSKGNVYLLQKLSIKGDKVNKSIMLPVYVVDVAKVQMYCAWAETVLGEAPFDQPVK
jgi:hypothetical protein